jgi:hypothetical protein
MFPLLFLLPLIYHASLSRTLFLSLEFLLILVVDRLNHSSLYYFSFEPWILSSFWCKNCKEARNSFFFLFCRIGCLKRGRSWNFKFIHLFMKMSLISLYSIFLSDCWHYCMTFMNFYCPKILTYDKILCQATPRKILSRSDFRIKSYAQ